LYNQGDKPSGLTLIREQLPHNNQPENPSLRVEQLLGTWQGTAVTIYPDFSQGATQTTKLEITQSNQQLTQKLSFAQQIITSQGLIKDSYLDFTASNPPVRVLLLSDGASATFPIVIEPGQSFFLEMGWLIQPLQRQRLIRHYNPKGEWISLTLVTENKVR
jgi:hypothetical protein